MCNLNNPHALIICLEQSGFHSTVRSPLYTAATVSHHKHDVRLVFFVTFFRAAQQRTAKSEHQSHLHGRCVDWERLEAYRSGNSWTCGYIESRCSLECPPHGKADCAFTSTVIGDLAAKGLLNQSEEKKNNKKKKQHSCGKLWD